MKTTINNYFDKIYVLNLDKRLDRWANTKRTLEEQNITNYVRWSATDGSEPGELSAWKKYVNKCRERRAPARITSPGAWGVLSSMYKLLQNAKTQGYKHILVLQDDIVFHQRFNELFERKIGTIPHQKWKLVYLGTSQYDRHTLPIYNINNRHLQNYYHPNGRTMGDFAVGISSVVFDEIMELIKQRRGPMDDACMGVIQQRYNKECFVLQPYLVVADLKESDCRKSRDQSEFSNKFGWDLRYYGFPYNPTVSIITYAFSDEFVHAIISNIKCQTIDAPLQLIIVDELGVYTPLPDDFNFERLQIQHITFKEFKDNTNRFGIPVCLNIGLLVASGNYITFQRPDRLSCLNRLEDQVQLLQTTSQPYTIIQNENNIEWWSLMLTRKTLNYNGFFKYPDNTFFLDYLERLNKPDGDYCAFVKKYDDIITKDAVRLIHNTVF